MRTVVLVVAAVAGVTALLGAKPQSIQGFTNTSAVGGPESPLRTEVLGGGSDQKVTRGENFPGSSTRFNDLNPQRDESEEEPEDASVTEPVDPAEQPKPKPEPETTVPRTDGSPAEARGNCRVIFKGQELNLTSPDGRAGFVQTPQGIVSVPCLPPKS